MPNERVVVILIPFAAGWEFTGNLDQVTGLITTLFF